jgi:hypothetical protein
MARIRFVKPETFDDPDLCELPPLARWLFIGLWTQADREGRMEDDPRRIKTRLLPGDDVNADDVLNQLAPKFITRYSANGSRFLQINNFVKHQHPHPKEAKSVIPCAVKSHGKPRKARASKPDPNTDPNSDTEVRTSADADFETFRKAYPPAGRAGGSRAKAAFAKARQKASLEQLLTALEQHKRSEQWQDPKYIPGLMVWLNQERWLQELPTAKAKVGDSAYYSSQDWRDECQHEPSCGTRVQHQQRVELDNAKGAA